VLPQSGKQQGAAFGVDRGTEFGHGCGADGVDDLLYRVLSIGLDRKSIN
jgi:hypothetical protein